ncbi:MAG: DUF1552 domain-containing protein [Polyangiaceae bacterium]
MSDSRGHRMGRRAFLTAASGAAIALPFLESTLFGAKPARGAPGVPTRFVIYQTGEGTLPSRWTPPTMANDQLMLTEMLAPLSKFQSKINVISGVGNHLPALHTSNGHNAPGHTLLTANVIDTTGNGQFDAGIEVTSGMRCLGPSIDHFLADRLGVMEPLNLAVGTSDPGENRMFYKVNPAGNTGANPEAPLEDDPVAAFQTNIAGLPTGTTTRADRFRARRGSVLNGVMDSFGKLKKTVSVADQHRLDDHLDALSALEKSLNYIPPAECGGITQDVPPGFSVPKYPEYAKMDQQATLMVDILFNVLKCGARQIATIQDTQYDGPSFEFLPVGPVSGWHAQVHNDPALGLGYASNEDNPTLRAGFLYYATVFNQLLEKLDGFVEPNGKTILDNSVVLWISEFGWGQTHDPMNLPIVIAGSGQGRIQTGRHLARSGKTTGDLFRTLLSAFDVTDTAFGYEGAAGLHTGAIPGLVT